MLFPPTKVPLTGLSDFVILNNGDLEELKELSKIPDDVYLLSPSVLESILKLKQKTAFFYDF